MDLKNVLFISIFGGCFLITTSSGQTFTFKDIPHENLSVDFRFIHPHYKSPAELSTLSGVYDFNISYPFGSKWNFNLAFPLVVYNYNSNSQYYLFIPRVVHSKNVLGNVFLGVQSKDLISDSKQRYFSVGIFLPTAAKEEESLGANLFGFLTDYYDLQKYLPETLTFYANVAQRWLFENNLGIGLDIGSQYLISTKGGNAGGENQFVLHYGLSSGVDIDDFNLRTEFTGVLILSGGAQDFADRFFNFLSIGLGYTNFLIKPSIFYQINMHELYDNLSSGNLGIKLSYILE